MTEMVERVARTICEHDGGVPNAIDVSDGRASWERYSGAARAAIEAMMEPTRAMTQAAGSHLWDKHGVESWAAEGVWQAMLSAALGEPTGEV